MAAAVAAAALAAVCSAPAVAQEPAPDFGPPPSEPEHRASIDRAAARLFGARLDGADWRDPRRGWLQGRAGYIACGDIRLRGRAEPVTVAAIWRRGDVETLLIDWRFDGSDPFASQWDLPMRWVSATPGLDRLCSTFDGSETGRQGTAGETFEWAAEEPRVNAWRVVSRRSDRLADNDRDDFGRLSACIRFQTRIGRRYRLSSDAGMNTSLSVTRDRRCSGDVIRWNEDRSAEDRNPQVEFDGAGTVYVYLLVGAGGAGNYTLTLEEGDKPAS